MNTFEIEIDDLSDGRVVELLRQHHEEMFSYSPPESIHALDTSLLRDPALTIWRATSQGELAGCGALKQLSEDHGEIKSMRTARSYLRQGVAGQILSRLVVEARLRGYKQVSLETGTNEAFIPAISLYKKFGFEPCDPFGDYRADPYSTFLTLPLK